MEEETSEVHHLQCIHDLMMLMFYKILLKFFFPPSACDDPPRPSFDSQLSRDMAGYMPARADFMEVSALFSLY